MKKFYAGRNSRTCSNSINNNLHNAVSKHETEYQIWVNGKRRNDVERYNKMTKLPNDGNAMRVTLNHYGQGLQEGDVVRIFNISPYFKLFEGRYESGVLVCTVPG